ncbi:hypothetical protein [Azospirillum soli]|uniref:hypothetical protein n=1 Tax=Azospirillum soli TaxID=1304799 RepID=UPI001AE7F16A|nr:hypothetical protein [Azospirillum soli]MBP2313087.1 hypothetical protein [Azospirillum soli]
MSEDRQWVELDPTNGAGTAKPQEASRDTAQEMAKDAGTDTGKDAPTPATPTVEGGA